MSMILAVALPLLFAVCALGTVAASGAGAMSAQGAPMRVCTDEMPHPPRLTPEGDGLLDQRIRAAARIAGIAVVWHAAPIQRCLGETRTDVADAFPAAAASADMRPFYAYPMAGGAPDPARASIVSRMTVYRRKGSAVTWNGNAFTGLHTPALVLRGTKRVHERLAAMGVASDAGGKTFATNFAKLLAGRADLVIGPDNDGQALLALPEYGAAIEALPVPFSMDAYYLAVSRRYYALNRERVERIWDALADGAATR